jgi:AcrR family transcriptional regulator
LREAQRQRLLTAVPEVVAEHGFGNATVTRLVAGAGISKLTFYEQFAGKEDCVLAAMAEIEQSLLNDVRIAVEQEPVERAPAAALQALLAFAEREPAAATLLMGEALAGSPRILDARDRSLGRVADLLEDAYAHAPVETLLPDISPLVWVGGVGRLIVSKQSRGEATAALQHDLERWLESYRTPLGHHRWRDLIPHPPPPRSPGLPLNPLTPPPPLEPGRPRLSPAIVATIHCERILFAIAEICYGGGYDTVAVAGIVKRAGVDKRVFYSLFANKQAALSALNEFAFRHTMAITAAAFFNASSSSKRVWEATVALAQYVEQNPMLPGAILLGSYAAGRFQAQHVEDLAHVFTLFLQDGSEGAAPCEGLTIIALEAIAACAFEVGYRQTRSHGLQGLSGLVGHLAHISLAPVLGAAEASRRIELLLAGTNQADAEHHGLCASCV